MPVPPQQADPSVGRAGREDVPDAVADDVDLLRLESEPVDRGQEQVGVGLGMGDRGPGDYRHALGHAELGDHEPPSRSDRWWRSPMGSRTRSAGQQPRARPAAPDLGARRWSGLGMAVPEPLEERGIELAAHLAEQRAGEQAAADPIRRWMRHTESSIPVSSSAWCQAKTCWGTPSTGVPSRSNTKSVPSCR